MEIVKLTKKNFNRVIKKTARIINGNGLVVFPSDTVYGLLADTTNPLAVDKLIKFKNRPPGKPISVFVQNWSMIEKLVKITKKQKETLQTILPGQFTVVLNSNHLVNPKLESEKKTLGIRLIDYKPVNKLLSLVKKPLTATSANLSGRSPHYSIDSFLNSLPQSKKNLIDLIIDAGKLPRNKPSTVIDLTKRTLKILRQGEGFFTKKSQSFISNSENETKKIAQKLWQNIIKKDLKKCLVFILEGELGAGKTIFIKGIAEKLGINNIISPTFVVFYEYPIKNTILGFKKFYHFDLYQIQEEEEFTNLEIVKLLKPENIIAFEWGEKTGQLFSAFQKKSQLTLIKINYLNQNKRKITVSSQVF